MTSKITTITPAGGATPTQTEGRYVILVNNCFQAVSLNNNPPTANNDQNFQIDTQTTTTSFKSSATLLYINGYNTYTGYTNCGRWIVVSIQ